MWPLDVGTYCTEKASEGSVTQPENPSAEEPKPVSGLLFYFLFD
jgi:hypothetical protein